MKEAERKVWKEEGKPGKERKAGDWDQDILNQGSHEFLQTY